MGTYTAIKTQQEVPILPPPSNSNQEMFWLEFHFNFFLFLFCIFFFSFDLVSFNHDFTNVQELILLIVVH